MESHRLWRGTRVSASFQIFALTVAGNVLGGEGNFPAGECPGEYDQGEISRGYDLHSKGSPAIGHWDRCPPPALCKIIDKRSGGLRNSDWPLTAVL